jgi:sirohydrochlorin cobaltochelatase
MNAANSEQKGLVLFGHGARDPRWADTMEALAERIGALDPELPLQLAFLEFMSPDLSAAVDVLVARGVRSIVVAPVFLAAGGHVLRDLPDRLAAIAERHPGLRVTVEPALGSHLSVIDAMAGICVGAVQAAKKPVD